MSHPQTESVLSRPQHAELKRISLAPFVAVLYAYCAGGPFGFEAIVSTAGPGMALVFLLTIPFLFSVPVSLAQPRCTAVPPKILSHKPGYFGAGFAITRAGMLELCV